MNLYELRLKEMSLLRQLLQEEDELLMMYEGLLLGPNDEEDNAKRNLPWCVNELARLTVIKKKTTAEKRRVKGLRIILNELDKLKSQTAS